MIIYAISQYQVYEGAEGPMNWPIIVRDLALENFTLSYQDATDDAPAPPLDPNCMVAQLTIEQAALDWILNSPDYGEGAILYDLPNPYPGDGTPNANEYGKRRSYMAKLGIKNDQVRELLGHPGNPKTRKNAADDTIAWVRTLPKKE